MTKVLWGFWIKYIPFTNRFELLSLKVRFLFKSHFKWDNQKNHNANIHFIVKCCKPKHLLRSIHARSSESLGPLKPRLLLLIFLHQKTSDPILWDGCADATFLFCPSVPCLRLLQGALRQVRMWEEVMAGRVVYLRSRPWKCPYVFPSPSPEVNSA